MRSARERTGRRPRVSDPCDCECGHPRDDDPRHDADPAQRLPAAEAAQSLVLQILDCRLSICRNSNGQMAIGNLKLINPKDEGFVLNAQPVNFSV